ncbi:MAG: helix-turn-helix transcriptional regulator [Kofleriaceae bacterium]
MHSHLVMGGGRTLYIGPLHRLPRHRFAANAVLIGLDDAFELAWDGQVERHTAAFVRGWQWHALDFHGGRAAVLFLEPGARPHRRVDARALRRSIDGALGAREPALWAELFQTALDLDVRSMRVEARVASAARFLSTQAEARTSAVAIAKRLGMSTSHIEHRFRDQLGVPMGAYRAWYRMQAATALALLGRNLTELAHATGFYDSAHFSRLFHQMFGLPPSKVFTAGLTGAVVEAPWVTS